MKFTNTDYIKCENSTWGLPINLLTNFVFLIKFEPCPMCRPALYGCYKIYAQNFHKCKTVVREGRNFREPFIVTELKDSHINSAIGLKEQTSNHITCLAKYGSCTCEEFGRTTPIKICRHCIWH